MSLRAPFPLPEKEQSINPPSPEMTVRVGCHLVYETEAPAPILLIVRPRADEQVRIIEERLIFTPPLEIEEFTDANGNLLERSVLPPGQTAVRHDALVGVTSEPDSQGRPSSTVAVEDLPSEVLRCTLPSRYCDSDKLLLFAAQNFGHFTNGVDRVIAICNWVHWNIKYVTGSGRPDISASEIVARGFGVCRDFAHVAIALCRAVNIPARYVTGHLPDIGCWDPGSPMDFHAYFEAFLGDRWCGFDARFNTPRIGRVKIAHGLDAVDVAFSTVHGQARLASFDVWAYQVDPNVVTLDQPVDISKRLDGNPKSDLVEIAPVKLRIHHRTSYHYDSPVSFGRHQFMLRPREGQSLHLDKCFIEIFPKHRLRWLRDPWENNVGIVEFTEMGRELVIDCEFVVETSEANPFDFIIEPEAIEYPFNYDYDLLQELRPLIQPIYVRDESRVREWLNRFWRAGKRINTFDLLQQINCDIYRTLDYRRREERGVQSPAETLENNSGSCRDFAALFIEACRVLGLAARFVSGYTYSSDVTGGISMHAWGEVFLPGAGWIGFDPSLGILADAQFVPVAVSRHPESATPVSGTYIGTLRAFLRHDVSLFVEQVTDLAAASAPVPALEAPVASRA